MLPGPPEFTLGIVFEFFSADVERKEVASK
jgi:hypothetical protein